MLLTLLALAPTAAADMCPNADKRWGPSAKLPDCRAYELVTPRDTNGQTPYGGIGQHYWVAELAGSNASMRVTTPSVSADGRLFQYQLPGTALEDGGGNGYMSVYLAERSAVGWSSAYTGTDPATQSNGSTVGGASHDFKYQAYEAVTEPNYADLLSMPLLSTWMRLPGGSFRPAGEGTLPADPDTDGFPNGFLDDLYYDLSYISPSGDHQVVWGAHSDYPLDVPVVPLTPDAPPAGVNAVYDRTVDGLHLVSIRPDGSVPTANSWYAGASRDGSVIAFMTTEGAPTGTLYVRIGNQTTKEIVTANFLANSFDDPAKFAGMTNERVFYRNAGDLYAYDFVSEQETQITSTGEARFVRVSEDGSRVFFLSNTQLDGTDGVAGEPNLYVWDGSDVEFVATTRSEDTGVTLTGTGLVGGIDFWVSTDSLPSSPANRWQGNRNTTRATDDGSVLVFTSSADVTGQNPGNFFQVYRWEAGTGDVACVSCPLDGADTTANSLLTDGGEMSGSAVDVPNLTQDGQTVFFESDQRLAAGDTDSVSTVYQWRDGELALLSSGDGARGDHIVGATRDGSQVFINTTDRLVAEPQADGVPAIYSVRVGGGFPLPDPGEPCSGDACLAPTDEGASSPPAHGSVTFAGPGDPEPARGGVLTIARRKAVGSRFRLVVRTAGAGAILVQGKHVKNVRKRLSKGGRHTLTLRLTKKGKRLLKGRGRLRVPLRVTFTPRSGERSSKRLTLTTRTARASRDAGAANSARTGLR